ncbi:MAG TPA: Type 1 glutamine amidotransferase-like domain-containing protein [Candidatus Saccharibacteria bacterium]|nr:Type 1 glutamine amidotransferase-like domain-containing protein [Candidatus Saccharibacteria bacterium]
MAKLYLSSYRLPTPDDLIELIGKPAGEISVAIIPNAKDYYIPRAKAVRISKLEQYYNELGLKTSVIDLLATPSQQLKAQLLTCDAVHVAGGNTFSLRYASKKANFDSVVESLLHKGIVYIGESAGAILAGISLKSVELDDEPLFAEEIIYEGLGLVPYFILPHADNPSFIKSNQLAKQTYQPQDMIVLNDNQAAIFDGATLPRIVTAHTLPNAL